MRLGLSSSGRWWVTMGPLGWLLYLLVVLPVLAALYLLMLLSWLFLRACKAIAGYRAPTSPGGSS